MNDNKFIQKYQRVRKECDEQKVKIHEMLNDLINKEYNLQSSGRGEFDFNENKITKRSVINNEKEMWNKVHELKWRTINETFNCTGYERINCFIFNRLR